MGERLRDQWKQIRGDAKWAAITAVGGWVVTSLTAIIATLITWWGWVLGLPGPYLFVLALAIMALCVTLANGLRQWWVFRQWEQGKRPLPPSPSLPPTEPRTLHKPAYTLPLLTTEHTTTLIKVIQLHALRIKIVSIPESLPLAEDLERALRIAGGTFVIDPETNKTIFLARLRHPDAQIVFRYRESNTDSKILTFTYSTLALALQSILTPPFALQSLTSASRTELFPPESSADYFQIEIGGAP